MDGGNLTFHLAGINNQNFIMRDEETGSWWQQVSGRAILGPLMGRRLRSVFHDEITFSVWKREHPAGRVLRPDPGVAGKYASADWESRIAALPVVTPRGPGEPLPDRATLLGITHGSESRAYPRDRILQEGPINDRLGDLPILLAAGEDGKSIRAFDRRVDGRALEFFLRPGARPWRMLDGETGSQWDFTGQAVEGPLAGRRLARVPALADYWFDWKTYHPTTDVYSAGLRPR